MWRTIPVLMLLFSGCVSTTTPVERSSRRESRSLMEQYGHLAIPPGNVRVTIERHEIRDRDRAQLGAALRYRGPHVTVAAGSPPVGMWHAREGFSAALSAGRQQDGHRSSSRQFLMLQPGTEASMELLESQPQPWTVVIPVYRGAMIVETYREEVTGTGFFVAVHQATPQGVEIELTPWFHSTRREGILKVEELTTRVTLKPGVPAIIMADETDEHDVTRQLLSYQSRRERSELIVLLTAEIGGE